MSRELTIADLKFLKNLYKVNWPRFVPTFTLFERFIERFEKHPEWQEKVIFLTVNEESLKCGTFLMIYCNYVVTFNSLEAAPYTNLEKLLNDLDYSEEKAIWSMESHHAEVVGKIVKLQNLEVTYDESSKCFFCDLREDDVTLLMEKFGKPPQGFYYDSLKQSDVSKMSETTLYILPPWYFENIIKYNVTTGLYTNDGKLVAWTAMHERGESGMTQVDANYQRNKLASGIVVTYIAKLFAMRKNIFIYVFDKNKASKQLIQFLGHVKIIGSHRFMNLRKNGKFTAKSQL